MFNKRRESGAQDGAAFLFLTGTAFLLLFGIGGDVDAIGTHYLQTGTITVRQQIILRLPRTTIPRGIAARSVEWRERRGPRCVAARQIAGVSLVSQESVDLVMRDASRIRARLGRRCPALDFYRGFYVTSAADGQICADRDVVRSRAGRECEIDQFRGLQAVAQ